MSKILYDFSNENFVVTGASSGMGRDIAIKLAASGANVLALARNLNNLESIKAENPKRIFITNVDVCDDKAMEEAIKEFVLCSGKLKGAVHCAGIEGFTPLRTFDRELSHKIMEISFWGGMNLSQIVNKKKYSVAGCSTVLFSSVAAIGGKKSLSVYSAAKAALNIATRSWAKEIAGNKNRINTILPGWVKTNMTEQVTTNVDVQESIFNQHLLGIGAPDDVTGMVMFLLSDEAKWITGTNVVVDGGYLAGAE